MEDTLGNGLDCTCHCHLTVEFGTDIHLENAVGALMRTIELPA